MPDDRSPADPAPASRRPSAAPSGGYVLKGGTLARAYPPMVARADLRVLRGQIAETGENLSPLASEEVVDCRGALIMPGFVSAHAHLGHALARGSLLEAPAKGQPPRDPWDDIAAAHDESSLYHSAVAGSLEALSRGVTGVVDLVGGPAESENVLETVAHALEEVGLRAVLSRAATTGPNEDENAAALRCLEETRGFLSRHRGPFLAGLVGVYSPIALDAETLAKAGDLAARRNVGVHLHVGETSEDSEEAARRYGLGLSEHLLEANVLSPRSLLVVGAHLSFEELAIAREAGCWFAWCPRAAMALGREQPAAEHLPPDRAALGTDSMDIDPLAEMQAAWLTARAAGSRLPAERFALMATNAQRLAAQCLGVSLGTLDAGAAADLAIFDYEPASALDEETLAEHLIYGLRGARARSVMVNGRFLLRDGKAPLGGREAALERARREAAALRSRLRANAAGAA